MMSRILSRHPAVRLLLAAGAASLLAGCSGKETHKTGASDARSSVADGSPAPGPVAGVEKGVSAPLDAAGQTRAHSLARSSGCLICHSVRHRIMGPAFAWVAYRFRNDPQAEHTLEHAIRHGISGKWGSMMPMPAQDVSPEQARLLARWVLSQTPKAPPQD